MVRPLTHHHRAPPQRAAAPTRRGCEARVRIKRRKEALQHGHPCFRPCSHPRLEHGRCVLFWWILPAAGLTADSLLLPYCRQAIPWHPSALTLPFPFETLRHRCAHSDCLRPPPPHRLRVAHRSMSSTLLESGLPGHAGPYSYDGCLCGCRH